MSIERRRQNHPALSIVQQCGLVSIRRSVFYYVRTGESPLNLTLMRLIDEAFLECPFYGSRQMAVICAVWATAWGANGSGA